jgi:HAD superfamily hydrolase (TIGR01490 family)
MKKAAFFDVDYTLYNGYLASNLTRFLTEKGYADKALIQKELKIQDEYALGEIDYREAARRALQLNADAIKGKTPSEVAAWLKEFSANYNFIYPWAFDLMKLLRQKDYEIYLISAALEPCVKVIADALAVEKYYGTTTSAQGGVYDGELELILNFEEKHNLLQRLLAETKHEKHVGFGDSVGDVDMLKAMDMAVVYNPKSQGLISLANERRWFIANESTILNFARREL